jgi:N-acetylmuramoyl-L-alanine amidase
MGKSRAMRFFLVLVWLLAAASSPAAHRSPSPPPPEKYEDLQSWALSRKFAFYWNKRDETVLLSNRWSRVVMAVDSKKIEIAGISVWLSFPLVPKSGSIYIASKDLQSVLDPILFPAKNKHRPLRVIAISAGHGGKDPGFQTGSHQEKKYTLLLALELEKVLEAAGFRTVQIRRTDRYVTRDEQINLAKLKGADTFICLHYNSAESETNAVKGVEVYCLTPAGAVSTNGGEKTKESYPGNSWDQSNILLAYETQRAIVRNFGITDRGVRHARFEVLRNVQMPAILIEGGFLSNPEDARKILDGNYRKQMAHAIVDGLLSYKRVLQR